ncbi:MAG: ATP-binding protein [bacterium]
MEDKQKTKEQLIKEIKTLKKQITEFEKTEKVLKESEKRYKMFVHAIPDIIYEMDTKWKFTFVSEAIKQFGYTPEELIGKSIKGIIHHDDFKNVIRSVVLPKYKGRITENAGSPKLFDERRTQHRMTKHLEVRLLLKNQNDGYRYCEVHSSGEWDRPITLKNKKFLGSFGIIRDITTRKQIEKELKKTYKKLKDSEIQLIQSEKMVGIGQFATATAHEINNPLSGIIGNLEILKEDYLEDTLKILYEYERRIDLEDERLKEHLEDIRRNLPIHIEDSLKCTEHIKEIITQLLTFSRPDERKPMEETDINKEIDKSISFVWHEIKYKCDITKDFQPLPKILSHPTHLAQVFINFLTNAAQAIEDKGHITIKTYLKESHIFIEFTDDGKGIPKKHLDKIFDAFFTTKEAGKGTGLGLTIAYKIIKDHRGTIDVVSELGKGTTFTIKLPID